jgi:type II secretory pathway component PulM
MDGLGTPDLYDRDFYAWTQDQAARLRALAARNDGLDAANLAEEVEGLGRSDRRAAGSLIEKLLLHLLKLAWHPAMENRAHWRAEVRAFRGDIADIFADSPSLRAARAEIAAPRWRRAARAFLDGLEAEGHDPRRVATALREDGAYFDLDTEVLNEDWFPPPAEE